MRTHATAAFLLISCGEPSDPGARCHDVCGPGTVCLDRRCVVAPPEPTPEPVAEAPRKRGKRRAGAAATAGADLPPFVPVDDSHVPRHDPSATQNLDETPGGERLADATANRELEGLEPAFNACIARAAEYSPEDIQNGSVSFEIGIRPSGKVSGVNASASKSLQVFGIVPCLRKTIFDHRFPAWNGPALTVGYRFEVR